MCVNVCVCVYMSGPSCINQEIAGVGLFALKAQLAAALFSESHILLQGFFLKAFWVLPELHVRKHSLLTSLQIFSKKEMPVYMI